MRGTPSEPELPDEDLPPEEGDDRSAEIDEVLRVHLPTGPLVGIVMDDGTVEPATLEEYCEYEGATYDVRFSGDFLDGDVTEDPLEAALRKSRADSERIAKQALKQDPDEEGSEDETEDEDGDEMDSAEL